MSQDIFIPPETDETIARCGAYRICQSSRGGVYAVDDEGQAPDDWYVQRMTWAMDRKMSCGHIIAYADVAALVSRWAYREAYCLPCWDAFLLREEEIDD
jgi:hypothetical protein